MFKFALWEIVLSLLEIRLNIYRVVVLHCFKVFAFSEKINEWLNAHKNWSQIQVVNYSC